MRRIAVGSWTGLVMLGIAGCAGAEGEVSHAEETAIATGGDLAGIPFDSMTSEQKGQYMEEVVVPTMKPLFQGVDAERYADFGCATCHGEDAREVGFRMPNTLAPLVPAEIGPMVASGEPVPTFMAETVLPRMAQLLGRPVYDSETHEGFGCLGCHATDDGGEVGE